MSALTANAKRSMRSRLTMALRVANTQVLFAGSFAALNSEQFGTPADVGLGSAYSVAPGKIPLGGQSTQRAVTGNTSADNPPELEIGLEAIVLENVPVTGVSAITDQGKIVYLANDNDLTLTRPAQSLPAGIILRHINSTSCDVYMFSFETLCALALSGGGKQLVYLGHYDANTVANGNLRTAIVMPNRGKILDVFAMIDVAIAGSSASALINLEIDGTNVTGGVVTIAEADAKGTKKAGTAVTAANTFNEGSVLDVEASSVTDATAGSFDLYATVEFQPGT